jgi:hypothetical protein
LIHIYQGENSMKDTPTRDRHIWVEESEIPGSQLVERVQELIKQPNVQRIIVRNIYDEVMVDIPLPVGVFFGGMMMLFAPGLVGLGGIGVLLSHVKIQVMREMDTPENEHAIDDEDDRPKGRSFDQQIDDKEGHTHVRASTRQINDSQGRTRVMNPFAPQREDEEGLTRVRIPQRRREDGQRTRVVPPAEQMDREPEQPEQPRLRVRASASQNKHDDEKNDAPRTIRIRPSVRNVPPESESQEASQQIDDENDATEQDA